MPLDGSHPELDVPLLLGNDTDSDSGEEEVPTRRLLRPSEPVARVIRSLCRLVRLYKPRSEGSTAGQSEFAYDTGTKSDAVDLSSVAHVPHLI